MFSDVGVDVSVDPVHLPLDVQKPLGVLQLFGRLRRFAANLKGKS